MLFIRHLMDYRRPYRLYRRPIKPKTKSSVTLGLVFGGGGIPTIAITIIINHINGTFWVYKIELFTEKPFFFKFKKSPISEPNSLLLSLGSKITQRELMTKHQAATLGNKRRELDWGRLSHTKSGRGNEGKENSHLFSKYYMSGLYWDCLNP